MLSRTSSRVSSPVALVVRSNAETTAAAGWPSASLWSRSQAARPTGESAIPYKVCGRAPIILAYSTCLYVLSSCSYARRSSAARPDGGGSPATEALSTSDGTVAGMLVWMGEQSLGRLQAHLVDDERTPVAPLSDVAVVAEATHQLRPRSRHALGPPTGARRFSRESVAGHRRDDHMERVLCARAMRSRVGQSIDDLQLLDDRAGPAVVDDERQRVFVLRPSMDEVDVQPVDLGDELRQCIQLRLARAPLVVGHPVPSELLDHRERHALGLIRDGLLLGPVRGRDASTKIVQRLMRHVDLEGADLDGRLDSGAHEAPPVSAGGLVDPPFSLRDFTRHYSWLYARKMGVRVRKSALCGLLATDQSLLSPWSVSARQQRTS